MVGPYARFAVTRGRLYRLLPLFLAFLVLSPVVQAGDFGTPSNLVGIWRMQVEPGAHLVSFPLLPPDATPAGILSNHFPSGPDSASATRVVTLVDGEYRSAWYNQAGQWVGDLTSLEPTRAYWLLLPDGEEPVTLTLIGEALRSDTTEMGTMQQGANLVAAPALHPLTLTQSGLTSDGLVSARYAPQADRLQAWEDHAFLTTWHSPDAGWSGDAMQFEPEAGYILWHTPQAPAFDWRLIRTGGETGEAEEQFTLPGQEELMHLLSQPVPGFETNTESIEVRENAPVRREGGVR